MKNHDCRQLLERLRDQGCLRLADVRARGPRDPHVVPLTTSDPQSLLESSAGEYEPLHLTVVESGRGGDSALWTELVERHHYLGHPGERAVALPGAFPALRGQDCGLSVVVQCGLEDGGSGPLDWMERQQRTRNVLLLVNNVVS